MKRLQYDAGTVDIHKNNVDFICTGISSDRGCAFYNGVSNATDDVSLHLDKSEKLTYWIYKVQRKCHKHFKESPRN